MGFSRSHPHERQRAEAVCGIDLGQAAGKVQPLWMSFRWNTCCHLEEGLHQFVLVIPGGCQCTCKAAPLLGVGAIDEHQASHVLRITLSIQTAEECAQRMSNENVGPLKLHQSEQLL